MKALTASCVGVLLSACAQNKPATDADTTRSPEDGDGDGLVGTADKCPDVASSNNADCPKNTQLKLTGEGTFGTGSAKTPFEVKASGDAPPERTTGTDKVTMNGDLSYTDAAGKPAAAKVTLTGTLEAKQDEGSRPFSFVDIQTGAVLGQLNSDFKDHSSLPVRLKLSAGIIPENAKVRYGVSATFMRAAFKEGSKLGDEALIGHAAFDSFETGFLGKYFLNLCKEEHWLGLGAEAGAAFIERVVARAKDPNCEGADCRYLYPASVEAYVSVSLEYAFGARTVGGPHVTLQPTFITSHSDKTRFLLPISAGFEF